MAEKPTESGGKPPIRAIQTDIEKRTSGGYKGTHPWTGRLTFIRPVVQQPKFKGKSPELKGNIYDSSD
jgi:hypothetical protein